MKVHRKKESIELFWNYDIKEWGWFSISTPVRVAEDITNFGIITLKSGDGLAFPHRCVLLVQSTVAYSHYLCFHIDTPTITTGFRDEIKRIDLICFFCCCAKRVSEFVGLSTFLYRSKGYYPRQYKVIHRKENKITTFAFYGILLRQGLCKLWWSPSVLPLLQCFRIV